VRLPDGRGAGRQIEALVQTTDLMPTILDALEIPLPLRQVYLAPTRTMFPQDMPVATQEVTLHGTSLLPLMAGEVDAVRGYAYTGHHGRQWSIRSHEWAYLLNIDGSGPPMLYHRLSDLAEQHNVVDQHPGVAAELELALRRWVASLDS
jgi:arylsulfatase A-like enzyme